jgi:pilus assembly protein Flp/PilA
MNEEFPRFSYNDEYRKTRISEFFVIQGEIMKKSAYNKKEKGQGLVEYALILVLVAIVVIAALMVLGPIIGGVFSDVNGSLSGLGSTEGDAPAVAPTTAPATIAPPTVAPTASLGICYLRWTGTQWVHWYDNTPEVPGPCP